MRPALAVERDEAVPEARDRHRIHGARLPPGLVQRIARDRQQLVRIELAQPPGMPARRRVALLPPDARHGLAMLVEDEGARGRGADVEGEHARHSAYAKAMAVLIASNLRKELSGDPLFDGVSFKVERRDRLALAGPNGAGKTTLLRALMGETELQGGELAWEKGARVALHDQRPPRLGGQTLREYALSGAADLVAAERELRRLEEAMAGGDAHAGDAAPLRRDAGAARARGRLRAGATARRPSLRGLGFSDPDLERRLETFSGGELTRASLARALAGQPDLLLLDEPTNHLDMASIEWLEQELSTVDAGVILVAHDRWFLESVGTAVLELEDGSSVFFPGKWHVWRQEKAARLAMQARFAERQAEDIARLERFVARFRYGTKSRQAQAKLKQIARIEKERVEVRARGGGVRSASSS